MAPEQQFKEIVETHGGLVADRSIELLLNDPQLTALEPLNKFISKNWRDSFTPTLLSLGCQFVGGNPKDTEALAVSISLMNLSFRIWDDIIDETLFRTLRPTFAGKFGKNTALIYGGTISSKAFSYFNEIELEPEIKGKINKLIWDYWIIMSISEINDLNAKAKYSAADKLNKIKAETINIQTCLKIGAIVGNGSESDMRILEDYGSNLGIMFELLKDVKVSLNLTLELESKIQKHQLPLLLLLAQEESEHIKEEIRCLSKKARINPENIGHLTEVILASESWRQYIDIFQVASEKCQTMFAEKDDDASRMLSKIAYCQSQVFSNTIKKL